jgi:hypothetical protein
VQTTGALKPEDVVLQAINILQVKLCYIQVVLDEETGNAPTAMNGVVEAPYQNSWVI